MNATEEITLIRRRIGGVEHELGSLKLRVDALEFEVAASRAGPETTPEAAVPRASEPVTSMPEVPPVMPPPLPQAAFAASLPSEAMDGLAEAVKVELPAYVWPTPPVQPAGPSLLEQARPWLERLQLWPPSTGGSTEVQLGAWWATRLGILFAVIGAVFFGVYISLNTPAWIKLIELAAVAGGITGLGAWLERKTPRFGQVVFAGGLALIFFTAMAAYTVPAVKVLDNRLVAASWQLAVTAGIGLVAWRRNSQPVATLAVILGFVAAWFSFSGGLQLFALTSALGLATLSVVWKRWLAWEVPSIAALAGYWGIYATLLVGLGATGHVPLPSWVWGFIAAGFAVFFWRDDRGGRTDGKSSEQEAWVQNVNSTAALALGWLTAWFAFPESLGIFYATAAVVLGLASWRRVSTVPGDTAGAVLLAKSLGALTLAVIKWTDPDTTALALMVQAGVMLVTNRRLRSAVIAAGSGVVATVALCYWIQDTVGQAAAVLTLKTLGRGLTFAGFIAWGLEMARNCGVELEADSQRVISRTTSVVGAVMGFLLATAMLPGVWLPAWCVGTAVVFGVAGVVWKRAESWMAAGTLLLSAHVALWSGLNLNHVVLGEIWGNAFVVLVPTILGAAWLGRDAAQESRRQGGWVVSALAVVTLGAVVAVGHGATAVLLTSLGLAGVLAVAAPWQATRNWIWLATWALGVGVVGHACRGLMAFSRGGAEGETARWIVALVAMIGPAALAAWPRGRAQLKAESPRGGTQWLTVMVGVVFALVVAVETRDASRGLEIIAGFALLSGALLTYVWEGPFRAATWVLTVIGALAMTVDSMGFSSVAKATMVAVAWLPALGWAKSAWVRERAKGMGTEVEPTMTAQTWLAGFVSAAAIGLLSASVEHVLWYAGAAAVALVGTRLGFVALVEVATGFALVGLMQAGLLVVRYDPAVCSLGSGFGAALAMAVVSTILARTLPAGRLWATASSRAVRSWLFSGLGLALVFALMYVQGGELQPYVTVGWGVAALAWFGFGLFARTRPDRLLGLAGLALCVPRVFLVDLHSTLYRIAAFGALGAVLLWVGFSYHRFRHLIADDSQVGGDDLDKKL